MDVLPPTPPLDAQKEDVDLYNALLDSNLKRRQIAGFDEDRKHALTKYWASTLVPLAALGVTAITLCMQTLSHSRDLQKSALDAEETAWRKTLETSSVKDKDTALASAIMVAQYASSSRYGQHAVRLDLILLQNVENLAGFDEVMGELVPYLDQNLQLSLVKLNRQLSEDEIHSMHVASTKNELQSPLAQKKSVLFHDESDAIFTQAAMDTEAKDYLEFKNLIWKRFTTEDALAHLWRSGTCLRMDSKKQQQACLEEEKSDTQFRIHLDRPGRFSDASVFWSEVYRGGEPGDAQNNREYFKKLNSLPCETNVQSLQNPPVGFSTPDHIDLTGIQLAYADLRFVRFRCSRMYEVGLHKSDLTGAEFIDTGLNGSDLHGTMLRGVKFSGGTLNGADFTDACMSSATIFERIGGFTNSQWAGSNWRDATIDDPKLRQYLEDYFPKSTLPPGCSGQ